MRATSARESLACASHLFPRTHLVKASLVLSLLINSGQPRSIAQAKEPPQLAKAATLDFEWDQNSLAALTRGGFIFLARRASIFTETYLHTLDCHFSVVFIHIGQLII